MFAQKMFFPQENNADCDGAIEIPDSLFGPTVPPEGFGQKLEIDKNPVNNLYLFEREHNTLWYKFEALYSAELSFDIIPVDTADDFDFLLFQHDGSADFCEKIMSKNIKPARTNMAKNRTGMNGKTGLSFTSEEEYVQSGPGSPYSKFLYAEQGTVYYMVVDNYSKNGKGHLVNMHYNGYPKQKGSLSILVNDKITRKKVPANILISEISSEDDKGTLIKKLSGDHNYNLELELNKKYKVICNAEGYFFYSGEVITADAAKDIRLKIKLPPVKLGEKLTLENINFYGDSTALLPSSLPALDNLVNFMHLNNKISIEIQGHVNAPGSSNNKMIRELSEQRSKSVYEYLVSNKVDPKRIQYKGYGNKEMIYPKPANQKQESANRRVDILVTGM